MIITILQRLIRDLSDDYIGVRKGEDIPIPPDATEAEEILAQIEITGDYPDYMIPQFDETPTSKYNSIVSANFCRLFLNFVEDDEDVRQTISKVNITRYLITKLFNGHVFNSLRKRWRAQNIKLQEEEMALTRKRNCRNTRGNQVNILHHCNCDL